MNSKRGGTGRGQGRKPVAEGQPTVTVSLRMTEAQRDKLALLGGAEWVRNRIDKPKKNEWITGVAYRFFDSGGSCHSGLILMRGRWLPEVTDGFPETKKMLEDHAKAEYAFGEYIEVEHFRI